MPLKHGNNMDKLIVFTEKCRKTGRYALCMVLLTGLAALALIIKLLHVSFHREISILQIVLVLLAVLVLLMFAAFFAIIAFLMYKNSKEFMEYLKEQDCFSYAEKIVGEMYECEEKNKTYAYVAKIKINHFT